MGGFVGVLQRGQIQIGRGAAAQQEELQSAAPGWPGSPDLIDWPGWPALIDMPARLCRIASCVRLFGIHGGTPVQVFCLCIGRC